MVEWRFYTRDSRNSISRRGLTSASIKLGPQKRKKNLNKTFLLKGKQVLKLRKKNHCFFVTTCNVLKHKKCFTKTFQFQ